MLAVLFLVVDVELQRLAREQAGHHLVNFAVRAKDIDSPLLIKQARRSYSLNRREVCRYQSVARRCDNQRTQAARDHFERIDAGVLVLYEFEAPRSDNPEGALGLFGFLEQSAIEVRRLHGSAVP